MADTQSSSIAPKLTSSIASNLDPEILARLEATSKMSPDEDVSKLTQDDFELVN